MGYSTANLFIVILVASIALRPPSATTASAVVGPSPLPPPIYHSASGTLSFGRYIKISLEGKAGPVVENGEDESEPPPPSSKVRRGPRRPWPKKPVAKSPPPPF
ncbi:hypothetical protein SDJN03_23347, partial [Cucurbita argyrosperma subsp. sororia]